MCHKFTSPPPILPPGVPVGWIPKPVLAHVRSGPAVPLKGGEGSVQAQSTAGGGGNLLQKLCDTEIEGFVACGNEGTKLVCEACVGAELPVHLSSTTVHAAGGVGAEAGRIRCFSWDTSTGEYEGAKDYNFAGGDINIGVATVSCGKYQNVNDPSDHGAYCTGSGGGACKVGGIVIMDPDDYDWVTGNPSPTGNPIPGAHDVGCYPDEDRNSPGIPYRCKKLVDKDVTDYTGGLLGNRLTCADLGNGYGPDAGRNDCANRIRKCIDNSKTHCKKPGGGN